MRRLRAHREASGWRMLCREGSVAASSTRPLPRVRLDGVEGQMIVGAVEEPRGSSRLNVLRFERIVQFLSV